MAKKEKVKKAKKAVPKKAKSKKGVANKAKTDVEKGTHRLKDFDWNTSKHKVYKGLRDLKATTEGSAATVADVVNKSNCTPRDVRHYGYAGNADEYKGNDKRIQFTRIEGKPGYSFWITKAGLKALKEYESNLAKGKIVEKPARTRKVQATKGKAKKSNAKAKPKKKATPKVAKPKKSSKAA